MSGIRRMVPLLVLGSLLASLGLAICRPGEARVVEESPTVLVVQIHFQDQGHLNSVAGELDIWEVHLEDSYVVAAVTPAQYRWLESLGYQLEVDFPRTASLETIAALDSRFHYFDDAYANPNGLYIVDFLQEVQAAFPDLTELIDIGDAWMAGQSGEHARDIWVLRITNESPTYGPIEDKPAFFLLATIHAREAAIPELAIRYIKYLTEGYNDEGGYGQDPDVTWLVDHNVAYVLVMLNPDGHWINEQDVTANRRKNMDWDDGCGSSGAWGVDLNRNHSFLWGCCNGSSGDPCAETYRGPMRGSEPETQSFESFFASVMRDQNGPNDDYELPPAAPITSTGIFISLHSYSDLILWPWKFEGYPEPPNFAQMETIGRKLAYYNSSRPSGFIGYYADGTTDLWTYGKFGIPSFTFEVGPSNGMCGGFFPDYECIDGKLGWPRNFWAENRPAFLYAHKIARTPYMTIYGPDITDLDATPLAVFSGKSMTLTASIADQRYARDPLRPIAGAEFFIDIPGQDGTGITMLPVDGSWGEMQEQAIAVLDTTGLSLGRHYLLVHGQNDVGDWGPFTALFFYVVEPGVAPRIEGYVRDARTRQPLEATVTAGVFHTDTDPATGYYGMTVVSGTYDLSAIGPGYVVSRSLAVVVHNRELVQQDFGLYPIRLLFFDDGEAGAGGWTAQVPWSLTTEAAYSAFHSWTDSPEGSYANNVNVSLRSPILDLSGCAGTSLRFWHRYAIDTFTDDYGCVEVSTDGGASWIWVTSYDGYRTSWGREELALPDLDGQDRVRIQFRFHSDGWRNWDGWYLDDIGILGGGPDCFLSRSYLPVVFR